MGAIIALVVAVIALVATVAKQDWAVRTAARLSALVTVSASLVETWNRTNKAATSWVNATPMSLPVGTNRAAAVPVDRSVQRYAPEAHGDLSVFDEDPGAAEEAYDRFMRQKRFKMEREGWA